MPISWSRGLLTWRCSSLHLRHWQMNDPDFTGIQRMGHFQLRMKPCIQKPYSAIPWPSEPLPTSPGFPTGCTGPIVSEGLLPAIVLRCSVTSRTLCEPMDCNPPGSSGLWDFPGKNTGAGCQSLLQGIFPIQGSNLCLLHWQEGSLSL